LLCGQVREAGVERVLCQALMRVAAGLTRAGHLPPYPAPFNAEEQRFEQRFAALHRLQRPEPLPYQQYARSVDVSGTLLTLQSEPFLECSLLSRAALQRRPRAAPAEQEPDKSQQC
jgi:hypothetical protein